MESAPLTRRFAAASPGGRGETAIRTKNPPAPPGYTARHFSAISHHCQRKIMSAHDIRDATRPDPDAILVQIADYVWN